MKMKFRVGDLIEFNLPGATVVIPYDIGLITRYDKINKLFIIYWYREKEFSSFSAGELNSENVKKVS